MPTYVYKASTKRACNRCRSRFEVVQRMADAPLTSCPTCGKPVERQIAGAFINTRASAKSLLNDKNLKRKGFTKLVNEGGGKFRKI